MMTEPASQLELDVQYAVDMPGLPRQPDLYTWALAAVEEARLGSELLIRIVDAEESRALNARYRGMDKPTNVLSFPFEAPPGVDVRHLGDLVICAPVVAREAQTQNKPLHHHWAHMVVHGVLHLQGYDHIEARQAQAMEAREIRILQGLGIPDPYLNQDMAVQ